MSVARAPGGLHCKWIVSIKSHSAAGTKWIAFSLRRFFFLFFLPITSQWVMVVKCLMASLPRQKKVVKAWARRLIMKDEFSGNFSVFLFRQWSQTDTRRNTEGTKLSEICPVSTVELCQSGPHFQNEVGQGHCLARYNYTAKLILSARDNGR